MLVAAGTNKDEMEIKKENYLQLREMAQKEGASLFGVADLNSFKNEISQEISFLSDKLVFGISIGVELCKTVLATIIDKPTLIYSWHYRQINTLLDHIGLSLSRYIQAMGFLSLPIAASQVVDWHKQRAHFSHKHLARLAGLGWIGRNNLLVNKKYGSGIRLVSILTDMPLAVDSPVDIDCVQCLRCISACPAQAIKQQYRDFRHVECYEKLKEFSRLAGIKYHICGICVKVCHGE